jgi:DNA-binding response OmpR family regulator
MTQLLIVEDSESYAAALRNNLEVEGFEVRLAAEGTTGLRLVRQLQPALVVLDLMLPGRDGFDVLRAIREGGGKMPVLVLTGRGDEQDKLRAFGLGADDYVTKPVGILELVARIRALLRRAHLGESSGPGWVRAGDLEIHPPTRAIRRGGVSINLTPKEYALLIALFRCRGRAVSRADLLGEVWHREPGQRMRVVDTQVLGLRQKVERDPQRPALILTVPEAGYMMTR